MQPFQQLRTTAIFGQNHLAISTGKSQSGILLNSLNERLRVAKNQPEFFTLNSGRMIRNGVYWRRGQVFQLTGWPFYGVLLLLEIQLTVKLINGGKIGASSQD